MNCQEILDVLHDYTSGELVVERHRTVEIHLSECQTCVRLVNSYRFTIRLARALPKSEPLPPEVEQRLRKVLEPHLKGDE